MTAVPKRRLAALSKQLAEGIPSEGTFEEIPRVRHVADSPTGPRVKGKVAIVTGMWSSRSTHVFAGNGHSDTPLQDAIPQSASVEPLRINTPRMVPRQFTSATMMTSTWKCTSGN
jgi:hypothetical protein